jgi:hypothetical protein
MGCFPDAPARALRVNSRSGPLPSNRFCSRASSRRELEVRLRMRLLDGRPDGAFALEARAWCVRGNVP